jgi:hypothetical protein
MKEERKIKEVALCTIEKIKNKNTTYLFHFFAITSKTSFTTAKHKSIKLIN